jgi:hypothetical protein
MCGMTLREAVGLMRTTCTHPYQTELLDRVLNAPKVKIKREMQPFTKKRLSLMQLRPRHLVWVEELGIREHYDRYDMYEWMLMHYNSLFGPLRHKSREVPMDAFRKSLMVSELLDLVETRRDEYAQELSQSRSS